jgi:hypothetical protein
VRRQGDVELGQLAERPLDPGLGRVEEREEAEHGHLRFILDAHLGRGTEVTAGDGQDPVALGAQIGDALLDAIAKLGGGDDLAVRKLGPRRGGLDAGDRALGVSTDRPSSATRTDSRWRRKS